MTKIILSGCEGESDYDVLANVKCNNVLNTYMHLRKGKSKIEARVKENPNLWVFIDSGGFTIRMQPDYLEKTGNNFRKYAESYLEWLYDHHKCIGAAANLDVHKQYPKDAEWCDAELKKFEADTGVPICYVYHPEDGPAAWEQMVTKHRYVGFSADTRDNSNCNVSAMLAMARKHGVWVHGFSITDTDSLGRDLYYSCDSTTWIMGAKYGRTMMWTGAEFTQFDGDNKQRRMQYRVHFINRGVDWSLIEADGRGERSTEIRAETLKMNAIAWMDYQDYLTKRMAPRAYWSMIDNIEQRIPSVDKATASEVLAQLQAIKFPVDESEKDADVMKGLWRDLFMYARRDEKALKDIDTAELKDAAKQIDEDFNETDRDRVIDFLRMDAINILVPGMTEKSKPRNSDEAMIPSKEQPKAREKTADEQEEVASNEIELPSPVLGDNEIEADKPVTANIVQTEPTAQPVSAPETTPAENAKTAAYPDFIHGIGDETLQLRARLLVDATRRYNSARTELNVLRLRRASEKEIKKVKKLADAANQEVKFLEKQIPADARKKLTEWMATNTPQKVAPDEPKRSYPITTANASQVGSLGGAPKGNINAMRHGIYSKKLPALACDTCPIAGQCYMHRQGHVCAFDKEFKKLQVTDVDSAINVLQAMTNTDLERVQRQLLFETVQGGVANTDTSKLLDTTFAKVDKVRELMRIQEAGGQAAANANPFNQQTTITKTETVSGPAAVLGSLFSSMLANKPQSAPNSNVEAERKTVEAEVLSVEGTKT